MRLVLQRLIDKKLYAKFNKCSFWLEEVAFLGHIVKKEGVIVDSKKIKAVMDLQRPMNVFEIQSFLGLARYYKGFIKGFLKISTPMIRLLWKNLKFS